MIEGQDNKRNSSFTCPVTTSLFSESIDWLYLNRPACYFLYLSAGRLRHNQSHLWTRRSFSLPGCRAVVFLFFYIGRRQRNKRPMKEKEKKPEREARPIALVVPLFCSVFSWPSRPSNRNKGMTTMALAAEKRQDKSSARPRTRIKDARRLCVWWLIVDWSISRPTKRKEAAG